jgi:hypothetical protein
MSESGYNTTMATSVIMSSVVMIECRGAPKDGRATIWELPKGLKDIFRQGLF